ncbi:MAG: YbhB/YbcL family Raf kinase inhibitor-like protein [Patescibacteria group bacterium]
MRLTSPSFINNQSIPSKYTCDGEDVNPALMIVDVPVAAKSLVLIVDDPDAPRGDWVHWLVWNIKPETTEIAENSVPVGTIMGITDFGQTGWGGPCPGSGTHHYQFKLYALDIKLDIDSSSQKPDLEKAMSGHILAQTVLVGLYQRK